MLIALYAVVAVGQQPQPVDTRHVVAAYLHRVYEWWAWSDPSRTKCELRDGSPSPITPAELEEAVANSNTVSMAWQWWQGQLTMPAQFPHGVAVPVPEATGHWMLLYPLADGEPVVALQISDSPVDPSTWRARRDAALARYNAHRGRELKAAVEAAVDAVVEAYNARLPAAQRVDAGVVKSNAVGRLPTTTPVSPVGQLGK